MCFCKRVRCVLLAVLLAFGTFPVCAYAAQTADVHTPVMDIHPEHTAYQKGEEIQIRTRLYNRSLNDLVHVRVWMEYDGADTMLVPGVTERIVDDLPYTCADDLSFRIGETKITDRIEAANNTVLRSLTLRVVRLIPKLTKFFKFLKNDLQRLFTAFMSLWSPKYTAELGECSVMYDGREIRCTFKCSYQLTAEPVEIRAAAAAKNAEQVSVQITALKNGFAGIVFGAEIAQDGSFDGLLFFVNASDGVAGIIQNTPAEVKTVARRNMDIQAGKTYTLCVQKTQGGVKAWLLNDLSEKDTAFPLFDIALTLPGDEWGLFAVDADVYADFRSSDTPYKLPEKTYCNPVHTNAPDPFVLYENGVYYMYSTNAPDRGFYADVSTDLVHWRRHSQPVAQKPDIYGEKWFWAPEVYRYNGKYYMLYSTEEHLALATADSPLGPFKKTADEFLFAERAIDGTFFFDDDGKIYMYFAYLAERSENLCVVEMEPDLLHYKPGTQTMLSVPEGWEKAVNEGPMLLKHNGIYYLTYSGDAYDQVNYCVGCMTSDSPTGPFTRVAANPVLQSNTVSPGCGHHCFAPSPDGSELFIVYHCHRSASAVHPRSVCIDRVRFAASSDGTEQLVIGGPTSTPQPMPQ